MSLKQKDFEKAVVALFWSLVVMSMYAGYMTVRFFQIKKTNNNLWAFFKKENRENEKLTQLNELLESANERLLLVYYNTLWIKTDEEESQN